MEELDQKVRSGLVLGYQGRHLRVDGLPQRLEQREVTACICSFETNKQELALSHPQIKTVKCALTLQKLCFMLKHKQPMHVMFRRHKKPNDAWICIASLPGASVHAILLERKGVLQA